MRNRAWWPRVFVILWLLWAAALLGSYFYQLWRLLLAGPAGWRQIVPPGTPWRGLFLLLLLALVVVVGRRMAIRRRRSAGLAVFSLAAISCGLALRSQPRPFPGVPGLPAFQEAAVNGLRGVAGAALVTVAALCAGRLICRLLHWQAGDRREALLYHLGIGFGVIAYLSFGLALLKQYHAPAVWALLVGLLCAGAISWAWRPVRRPSPMAYIRQRADDATSGQTDGLWQWFALTALLIAAIGALAPEQEYDALWYHLWLPKLWLQHGQAVDVIQEYISLYPLTWELVFGAGLVTGGQAGAKLLHFICLPLGALLVYQLTSRYLPRAPAWLAVALFVTVPIVVWEATTADVDLALAFYAGLAVYAVLRYLDERSRSWFALAVLAMGLALAVKHLGLIVLVFLTMGLAWRLWLADRDLRKALLPAVAFGLLSLLVPLPWYVRAWLASGNPVFPDLYQVFGAQPAWRWDYIAESRWRLFEAGFGRPPTLLNLLTLPWDMTVHAARYKGTLGPVFLLLLAPLALLRRKGRVVGWLAVLCLFYLAVWASGLNGAEMRFVVPMVPLLAALAAEALRRTAQMFGAAGGRKAAFMPGVLVTLLLALNLPVFIPLHEADRVGWEGWLPFAVRQAPFGVVVGRQTVEDYLTGALPSYAAWRYINTHLPVDARVLTFSGGDQLYSERDRLPNDATLVYPAVWGAPEGHEDEAAQALRRLGISHILFDKKQLSGLAPGRLAIAEPGFCARWCQRLYEDQWFVLYRLAWDGEG